MNWAKVYKISGRILIGGASTFALGIGSVMLAAKLGEDSAAFLFFIRAGYILATLGFATTFFSGFVYKISKSAARWSASKQQFAASRR